MRSLKSNKETAMAGFTLIELLVVIAIIGILSGIVIVSMSGARAKARDARRLSDMRQIATALQMYYAQYEKYPGPTSSYGESESPSCGGWDTANVDNDGDGKAFIEPLVDSGIMKVYPKILLALEHAAAILIVIIVISAGSSGCDPARGAFFVLGVVDMDVTLKKISPVLEKDIPYFQPEPPSQPPKGAK